MKKVLIITYYWPPAGGPGVQRWLKFVKYLRDYNWEPVIFTVDNPDYHIEDKALINDVPEGVEVIKNKIFEPYKLASLLTGKKDIEKVKGGFIESEKEQSTVSKITTWIRGNFFIPDARLFWIRPSYKLLKKYLSNNKIDIVISSGPPHSTHLIANKLKKSLGVNWIADFRDPWTNIDYYSKLRLTKAADKKHHKLEKEVLSNADEILVVSEMMKREFQEIVSKNITVLPNGFDIEINSEIEVELDSKFTISHIGSMNADRNPEILWKALSEKCLSDSDFKNKLEIKLIGTVSQEILNSLESYNLSDNLNLVGYLSHDDVILAQKSSQVLLLVLNNTNNAKGIVTGKFFEYLNSKRPILTIGPEDGDLAKILKDTKGGFISSYTDYDKTKLYLDQLFSDYENSNLKSEAINIEKYSRKSITTELAALMNKIVEESK